MGIFDRAFGFIESRVSNKAHSMFLKQVNSSLLPPENGTSKRCGVESKWNRTQPIHVEFCVGNKNGFSVLEVVTDRDLATRESWGRALVGA